MRTLNPTHSPTHSNSYLLVASFLLGVYTFRSSDRPVGPTGRTDWPVGRPITLQHRRYYNQLAGHIDLIDRCARFGYSLSDRSVRLVWQTVGRSLGPTDRSVRRSYRVTPCHTVSPSHTIHRGRLHESHLLLTNEKKTINQDRTQASDQSLSVSCRTVTSNSTQHRLPGWTHTHTQLQLSEVTAHTRWRRQTPQLAPNCCHVNEMRACSDR